MKKIKISDLKISPIRQEVLPKGFIMRVKKMKKILREVETSSLEEAVSNFQRDLCPQKELLIWENIAISYKAISQSNPNLTLKEKRKVFSDILIDSLG